MWAASSFTSGFLLLILVHYGSFQNQPLCGIPGNPLNGINLQVKTEYEFNEEIRYSCPAGWLKGDETRRCLRNGTWSGSVPVCLRSLSRTDLSVSVEAKECAHNKQEEISDEIRDLWTEPEKTGCSRRCKDLKISVLFKNGKLILDGFELTFPTAVVPNVQAFSNQDKSRTLCNISDSRLKEIGQARVNTTTVRFDCYSSKTSTGIYLHFHPDKEKSLSVCHITPLYHPTPYGCSLPDTPLYGKIQQKNIGLSIAAFDFRCDSDFELVGASSTECRINGTWSNLSPICFQNKKSSADRQENGTGKVPPYKKNFRCKEVNYITPVIAAVIGAGAVIILVLLIVIIYMCKRNSKVKVGKRLHNSSLRSNSFDIAYRRNRSDTGANNRHSTGTECHSNPDFGQEGHERPRSDVPDILENRVLNKVTGQTKRGSIPSAHIYADPVYSDMEDERGQSGVMMDNVLYNESDSV